MVSFINDSSIVRLLLILQTFKQPLGIQLLFVFVFNFTYFPSNLRWSIINQEWVTIFSPNLGLLHSSTPLKHHDIWFYLTSLLQHRLFKSHNMCFTNEINNLYSGTLNFKLCTYLLFKVTENWIMSEANLNKIAINATFELERKWWAIMKQSRWTSDELTGIIEYLCAYL